MLRKCISLCLALCATALTLFAQNNPTNYIRTDMIANSPTATSIARQGASNINMATGAVNLSLPIFTVQGNELSLPVSLNYSYDGFKPTQTSGWAGMGWSLSAGGVITRTVRGKVDGTSASGTNYWDSYVRTRVNSPLGDSFIELEQNFFKGITQGVYDTELDVYSFNFDGYSGRFVLHGDTAFVTPKQKLKVAGGPGASFIITTENGTKYMFSATETTTNKGVAGTPYTIPTFVSAWYLTRIENATATEQINLSYVSDGTISQGGSYNQTYKQINTAMEGTSELYEGKSIYPTSVTTLRLSQITSDKFTVTFVGSSAVRTDISADAFESRALERIEISDKLGHPLKSFKLDLSYMGTKYLKLNSLTEYASNYPDTLATPPQRHVFEYYGGPGALPINKALAFVDHFGYALGGDFSNNAIPNTLYPFGSNRTPNFEYTQVGAIKKVTYPTGGNTEFEYEQNVTGEGAGYPGVPTSREVTLLRGPSDPSTAQINGSYGSFVLPYAQEVTVNVARRPKTVSGDGISHNEVDDFKLMSFDGTNYITVLSGRIGREADNFSKSFGPVLLPAGTYYLAVTLDSKEDRMGAAAIYNTLGAVAIEGTKVGGIRLKKVTNTPVVSLPTQTTYSYKNDQGFSTGIGTADTYSHYNYLELIYSEESKYREVNSTMWSSAIAENSVNNNPHYYTMVTEQQTGSGETLMTRNYFDFKGPDFGTRPTKTIQYKKEGGNFLPIAKKEFEYSLAHYGTFRNMTAQETMKKSSPTGVFVPFPLEHLQPNNDNAFSIDQLYTKSQREVSYEGADSLVKTTRYDYDVHGTTSLMMERVIKPDGEQLITKYKYPENYISSLSNTFVAANVIGPAWETQTWRKKGSDSVLVAASFSEFDALSFKPVKQHSLTAKGIMALNGETKTGSLYNTLLADSRFEERASYIYNAKGRTISQQLKDGPATSYKWGYGAQQNYPVAEVKNALPTEFYFENFEDNGSATTGSGHSGSKYYNGDFSVSWTIPNGRSYVISYWYLDGSVWKYAEQPYTGGTTLTLGSAIDDIAIFPKDAQLSHYAYVPSVGISSSTDAKGLTTSYVYDAFQRLQDVKDQDGNIVKHYDYFTTSQISGNTGFEGNDVQSGSFTRNNCASGFIGQGVNYGVPANAYFARTKAEANALAVADVAANGQAYANRTGNCEPGGPNIMGHALPPGETFYVTMYNTSTFQTYNFTIAGDGNIAGIFNGVYQITITSASGFAYDMQMDMSLGFGSSVVFSNVTFNGQEPFPLLFVF